MNESKRKVLNNSKSGSRPLYSSSDETVDLQARLAAKARWKNQPGNRYTPEELKRMSEGADVKIYRRKRIVLRLV